MKGYSIHNFSNKLLQKSTFPRLREYIRFKKEGGKLDEESSVPVSVNLDLTSACSNRCDHCIDRSVLNTGKNLDVGYIKDILTDWKRKGLKSVIVIGGGEPTLHPNFEEIIEFLKKDLGLQIGIVSNGTRIEKVRNICHLLKGRDWVRISLDAATNDTFQKIHHPQLKLTLGDILSGVREMRRKHSSFKMGYSFLIIGDDKRANNVFLVNNISEISGAAKLAKENGFSYFSVKPLITPEGSRSTEISDKNLKEIKEEVEKAKKLEDENFKVMESINLLCFYDEKLKEAMKKQPKTCHVQFFRAVINPEGIFTCSSWRGFKDLRVADVNEKVTEDYNRRFHGNKLKVIGNFSAKEVCRDINCYYAPFNCWVEDLINSHQDLKKLKPIDDFGDYFF